MPPKGPVSLEHQRTWWQQLFFNIRLVTKIEYTHRQLFLQKPSSFLLIIFQRDPLKG